MIREFICKNQRKLLTIQDSAFPGQSTTADTEKFMDQLYMLFGRGFSDTLNTIHMMLRANRSLYISIDTDTKEIKYQNLETGKIKKIHPKHKEEEKDNTFKELEDRLGGLTEFQNNLINNFNNMGAKK